MGLEKAIYDQKDPHGIRNVSRHHSKYRIMHNQERRIKYYEKFLKYSTKCNISHTFNNNSTYIPFSRGIIKMK